MSNAKVRHRRRRRAENAAPTPLTDAQKREHGRNLAKITHFGIHRIAPGLLFPPLTPQATAMLEGLRAIAARRGDADIVTFHPDGHIS